MKTSIQQQWDEVWARMKIRNSIESKVFIKEGMQELMANEDGFVVKGLARDFQ